MKVEALPAYKELFEERHPPCPPGYDTVEGEIRAVHEGRKALAYQPDAAAFDDEESRDIHELAHSLGLAVLYAPGRLGATCAYIGKPENLWRAWAHQALWTIVPNTGGWNDGAEALESFLLGYSDEERATWMEYQRWTRLGWEGETLFFFLTDAQVEAMAPVSNRAFLPTVFAGGAVGVSPRGRALRRRHKGLVPGARRIVRAAVKREELGFLFYPGSADEEILPIAFTLDENDATLLNKNLLSHVQVLRDLTWT
jgi:hypothetical protein